MHVKKWLLLGLILVLTTRIVSAQEAIALTVGENKIGDITADAATVLYTLEVGAPQSVNIQLLAISPALTPTFRITDPDGLVIFDTANPGSAGVVGGVVNLASMGAYRLEVSAVGATIGQFVLSVQAGAPLAEAEPLTLRSFASSSVNSDETRRAYSFASSADEGLALTIDVTPDEAAEAALVITLRDADTDETLSLNRAGLLGLRFRLPATERNYVLELTQGGGEQTTHFTLCLVADGTAEGCTGGAASVPPPITPAAAVVAIDPTGECRVASAGAQSINVRSGAGTSFSVVAQLASSASAPVIGRLADNTWFQVNVGGVIGWVSAAVVTLGGNCAGISVVAAPVAPTAAPIVPTTAPPVTAPTTMPTNMATATATATATTAPIVTTFNFNLEPNFGTTALVSGFFPDPFAQTVISSGNIDAGYLGINCKGYASSAPDFRLDYTSGTASTLRFYFMAEYDTTMIINGPDGAWYCNDDYYTFNPGIGFTSPSSGTYDVWIGSFVSGGSTTGTLYVTGNAY